MGSLEINSEEIFTELLALGSKLQLTASKEGAKLTEQYDTNPCRSLGAFA